MSSAAEARYRIDAPNSKPRAVKVIALDGPSERIVKEPAQRPWNGATFFTASAFGTTPKAGESFAGWLHGGQRTLIDGPAGPFDVAVAQSLADILDRQRGCPHGRLSASIHQ